MKTEDEKCGNCEKKELRKHCDNERCSWRKCALCGHFGDPRRPQLPWRYATNQKGPADG